MINHKAHYESEFEKDLVQGLVKQGWLYEPHNRYHQEYALYAEDAIAWAMESQPEKWKKLVTIHGAGAELEFLKALNREMLKVGTLQVLKNGFPTVGGGRFEMSQAMPEDARNDWATARYEMNRLRVANQLKYNPAREWAIDVVLFINGLPIATMELKTDFNQPIEAAKRQYREDRLPYDKTTRRYEPLLQEKSGAIVHFAMSESEIYMTTKLDGKNTFFLPFNKGNNGHSGNPPSQNSEYPTAYFWQEIGQKDNWLKIFHQFVYVERKQEVDLQGNWKQKERLIFPRYHQFDAVTKMMADVVKHKAGTNYLCEHSAGSGKTATITWTAHSLTRLREADGTPLFHSVIVVTDRTVLDDQLQEAIKQIDHQKGLVVAINRDQKDQAGKSKSKQLEEALLKGTPIIVVTIQTFPYAMESILTATSLADRRFAIIIDEAHNSQTGSSASKLQATLALDSQQDLAEMDVETMLEKIQQARGKQNNLSHFAFTATPKHSTLMLFGRTKNGQPASDKNLPEAFHRYTMRQAIEEGFILDVLQGYVNYETAYQIGEKFRREDKRVDQQAAKRTIARWQNLHATNVMSKAQFIVEHFHHNVANLLNGKAKAMIVTPSRPAAMRYKMAIEHFIENNPIYKDYGVLVAFSGTLSGNDLQHEADAGSIFHFTESDEFTEANANNCRVSDLRQAFDRPEYRLMVVANKFQTGFDQPKLCAMYLDKTIGNEVEVVQTLSRLNRTFVGKDTTFVIDFANKPKHILNSFKRYDKGAEIDCVQDFNVLFDLKFTLDQAEIYTPDDVEQFKQVYFNTLNHWQGNSDDLSQHQTLYFATEGAANVFNQRLNVLQKLVQKWENAYQQAHLAGNSDGEKEAEFQREQADAQLQTLLKFKGNLAKFNRWYVYLAQLVDYGDPELENFAAFSKLLAKRLNAVPMQDVDISGIVLTGYRITKNDTDSPVVKEPKPDYGNAQPLAPITGGDSGEAKAKKRGYLHEILELVSKTFGDLHTPDDQVVFVNHLADIVRKNDRVMEQVKNNNEDVAMQGNLPEAVQEAIVDAMASYEDFSTLLLDKDPQARNAITRALYRLLKKGEKLVKEDDFN